ncbi:alpha/beta hydrolase [Microbacterium terregens]|uniref:Alpha/beta hydrolase n=1 Tax=Microbacterium terregens TaxID=69363 RepID=A0ABV5T3I5_9MICO
MDVIRTDFTVTTDDGVTIAVREVRPDGPAPRVPMVLLHGTTIPGLSEFDLPVPGGSLAEDLARKGHVCYIPDARGFGRSERPAEMEEEPLGQKPLVRTIEITRDLDAVVDHLRDATGQKQVGILGWGVGATCAAMLASLRPEKVSHLVLYVVVYGGVGGHRMFRDTERWDDPAHPYRLNPENFGGYKFNVLAGLEGHWNRQIPVEDKDSWRDPAMLRAFQQALLDGDPTSGTRQPPSYRSPNGMLEDLHLMAGHGQRLFHAGQVSARVMIVLPEYDDLARKEDIDVLVEDLCHAQEIDLWEPEGTTHYLLLDRPERGRDAFLERLDGFLAPADTIPYIV